jgi:hypothetical protein
LLFVLESSMSSFWTPVAGTQSSFALVSTWWVRKSSPVSASICWTVSDHVAKKSSSPQLSLFDDSCSDLIVCPISDNHSRTLSQDMFQIGKISKRFVLWLAPRYDNWTTLIRDGNKTLPNKHWKSGAWHPKASTNESRIIDNVDDNLVDIIGPS